MSGKLVAAQWLLIAGENATACSCRRRRRRRWRTEALRARKSVTLGQTLVGSQSKSRPIKRTNEREREIIDSPSLGSLYLNSHRYASDTREHTGETNTRAAI